MAHITLLALEGCFSSAIGNLVDGFWIANAWYRALSCGSEALFETQIVTWDGRPVRAVGNLLVQPDAALDAVDRTDAIVIPASMPLPERTMPGIAPILAWLTAQHERCTLLASACTGSFLLAEAGLLDGKTATTNWQFARQFERRYPQVRLHMDRILTEDGNIVCAGATSAVMHLGLHLIRRFGSEDLAAVCAKAFLIDPNRDSQAPYAIFQPRKHHGDEKILEAQQWLEENYGATVAIDELAGQVGISPRHFKRRFRKATGETPLGYLQNVRIEAAKQQLENTQENVNEITYRIGYEDSSTFRRLFKKHTGISPREYRDKFCGLKVA
jgi:transcriptional regulator GlxA family with amidase domain